MLVAAQLKVLEVDTSRLQFDDVQGRWNDVVGITYGGEDAMFVGDIALDTIDRYSKKSGFSLLYHGKMGLYGLGYNSRQ